MARRIGDVVETRMGLEGDVIRVRDLEGKEFTIMAVQEWTGDKGPYMAVQIQWSDGKKSYFFSSHVVILRKLREAAETIAEEPLLASIVRVEADNPQGFFFDIR